MSVDHGTSSERPPLRYHRSEVVDPLGLSCLPMPRGRHPASFDQVSEFEQLACRDYPSEKSVKVLDEAKQLGCGSVIAACRRKR
ncbi:hypothetical protein TNCV_2185031 [Trichonephila clavipes]|nr:hypothetical protein TNCV_2185031 [Trichonephila clavipes]